MRYRFHGDENCTESTACHSLCAECACYDFCDSCGELCDVADDKYHNCQNVQDSHERNNYLRNAAYSLEAADDYQTCKDSKHECADNGNDRIVIAERVMVFVMLGSKKPVTADAMPFT